MTNSIDNLINQDLVLVGDVIHYDTYYCVVSPTTQITVLVHPSNVEMIEYVRKTVDPTLKDIEVHFYIVTQAIGTDEFDVRDCDFAKILYICFK